MVSLKNFHIHPGLIVKAVHKPFGNDLHQIVVACVIFRQQDQVIVAVLAVYIFPVEPGAGGHVDLTADDGLDARLLRRAVKVDDAVHHPVIRDGQAVHIKLLRPVYQLLYLAGAV